ncbi:MAG: hypothetical protein AAFN81_01915 [Bacteroidota bacterium]
MKYPKNALLDWYIPLLALLAIGFREDRFMGQVTLAALLMYTFYRAITYWFSKGGYRAEVAKAEKEYRVKLIEYQELRRAQDYVEEINNKLRSIIEGGNQSKGLVLKELRAYDNYVLFDSSRGLDQQYIGAFKQMLIEHFGRYIFEGKGLMRKAKYYYMDLTYLDPKDQVFLNIEIDEPYDLLSGAPLNYREYITKRDDFFQCGYWGVVRFSERQVVTEPEKCVATLRSILDYINGKQDQWVFNYQ